MKKSTSTRRQFLKGAAALGTAFAIPTIVPATALGLDGATAPSERITMGLIGSGGQGTSNMEGFLAFKDVQFLAIADVDKAHREAAATIVNKQYGNSDCALFNDFRELNDRSDIDAVIIATPDHWHALNAIDALKKGQGYLCAKAPHLVGAGRPSPLRCREEVRAHPPDRESAALRCPLSPGL